LALGVFLARKELFPGHDSLAFILFLLASVVISDAVYVGLLSWRRRGGELPSP
jgi:hypothetical protein